MGNEISTTSSRDLQRIDSLQLWSVLRAEIARLDQGEREMEVVCGDNEEYDIHQHMERCKKHPGHKDFIPVNKLTLNHIPAPWRQPGILAVIKHQCDCTVKLRVHYTSPERPTSLGFGNLKGKSVPRLGTGWFMATELSDSPQPCPLKDCSFSNTPHEVSPFFQIETAAHVVHVYDNSEARKTVIEFFYDDEKDRSSVIKAEGINISLMDLDGDYCLITCVTHDPDWKQKLKHLTQNVMPKAIHKGLNPPLSFIVSHPHGGSKQVTFGDVTHAEHLYTLSKEELEKAKKESGSVVGRESNMQTMIFCKFKYTIPTCPGSSGAPMITFYNLSGIGGTLCAAPHSRHKAAEQVNESGYGVFGF